MPTKLTEYQRLIKSALEDVKGIETFATGGRITDAPLPGLSVKGVGPIGLPLAAQAKQVIEKSTQAPFGRGAETMVDTSVRLCRQVEAAEVELGEGWDAVVQRQAQKFCVKLGAQKEGEELVEARLYKMVLYEEGGFFKAHKDTEKEPGMFGTLVVQLPAKHEEGKLVVRHRGKEEEFDFSKGSSEYFFAAAFYADCEHELFPLKSGIRLVLLYNLVRKGLKTPRLAVERNYIPEDLRKAANVWEEELKDSPATTPGKPLKLAISLSHKYTEANLNFANLKGRDRMMADHLRSSGAFEVHLALIVREQEGGGEEDDYDDYEYGYYRGRGGNRRTSGFMTMVHVCNDEISVEKWVDETGETVENKGLEIDHEHETIDGEKLFHSDDEIDEEEDDGPTGNEGVTVRHWYHRACLVIWPRSFAVKIALSAGVESAVNLGRRCLNFATEDEHAANAKTLEEILEFAKRQDVSKSGPYLADFLEIFTSFMDERSSVEILNKMSEGQPTVKSSYSWSTPKEGSGCSTEQRRDAILAAVRTFKWVAMKDAVLGLIPKTAEYDLEHAAGLAMALKEAMFDAAAAAVAGAVVTRVAGSKNANAFKSLTVFLGMATAMNNIPLALEILNKMSEGQLTVKSSYSWSTPKVGSGCSTEQWRDAILVAVRTFKWVAMKDAVLGLIPKMAEYNLEHAAGLAMSLKEATFDAAAAAVAGAVVTRVAGSKNANAFNILTDFLGMATAMNDIPLALQILKKMAETSAPGCSTKERKEAILAAMCAFEWDAVKEAMLGVIIATAEKDLEHVEGLAMALKGHAGSLAPWHAKFDRAAAAVAGAAVKRVAGFGASDLEARARTAAMGKSFALVIRVLGTFPGCAEQEDVLMCQRMAGARAKAIRYEKPQPSNRQPYAQVPGHPEVTTFFRSDQKVMVYKGSFNGIKHARNFASEHGSGQGYNTSEKTSATWTPSGVGGRAKVTIQKTGGAYKHILEMYEEHQRELKSLEPLLGDLSRSGGDGPPAKKVKKQETEITISSEEES